MKSGVASGLLLVAICVSAIALFHFHGVTDAGYVPTMVTKSLFVWVANRWPNNAPPWDDFPYGWVAPLVSGWMLWKSRKELATTPREADWRGFVLVVVALALHWAGMRTQQTRVSLAAFVLLAWTIPFHLFGWRTARLVLAPAAFLFFSTDYNFLSPVTLQARVYAARIAALLLDGLGIGASSAAATIKLVRGGELDLMQLAHGTRALQIAAAIAVVLVFARPGGWLKKTLLTVTCFVAWLLAYVLTALVLGMIGLVTMPWMFMAMDYTLIAAGILLMNRGLEKWRPTL